jgi:hypothetical protein
MVDTKAAIKRADAAGAKLRWACCSTPAEYGAVAAMMDVVRELASEVERLRAQAEDKDWATPPARGPFTFKYGECGPFSVGGSGGGSGTSPALADPDN